MKVRSVMVAAALLAVGFGSGCDKKEPAPTQAEAKAAAGPAAADKGAAEAPLATAAADKAACAEGAACGEAAKPGSGGIADDSVACKHEVPEEVAKAAEAAPVPEATEADKAKAEELSKLADQTQHFGAPFATHGYLTFAELISDADTHADKTLRVDATIKSVCKKAGCWMILADGGDQGQEVRVKMKDHAFAVPRDCDGKRTVVEGVFMKQVTPEAVLKHYEQDAGRDPSLVQGDKVEYVMIASGVDIIASAE